MPLSVTCSCGHKFRVDSHFAGQDGPCPACGQTVKLDGPTVPQFDIFLSYSSKDKTIADAAVAVLEQRGLRCWVAPRNIIASKEWGESIIEGIESSGLMVLIFSQHANQSQQVIREVERAVAKGIPILPFRIEDIPTSKAMEYFISCHHWLDAFDPPLAQHLAKLADMAGHLLGGPPPLPAEADDPKTVAGKLNAAVGTLLARDKRLVVLTGLAAVLVVAALLVGLSGMFRGREAAAPSNLIEHKAQAEVLAGELHQLDPGQGFREQVSEVDRQLNAAATLFADKQFAKADAAYANLIVVQQKLAEVGQLRAAADDKRKSMLASRASAQAAHAEEFAKTDWDHAGMHAQQGVDRYGEASFRDAAEHWNNAAAAYSSAASAAKKSGLPQLQAVAFWTSMAVQNKWWFEKLRPQPQSAGDGGLAGFDAAPGFLPNVRIPGRAIGGGIPSLRPVDDWPPYQNAVDKGTAFLDLEARENLGVDVALIDRLIETKDLGIIDATATKLIDQIASRHPPDVHMAYRLGTNVAKLKIMCDLGASQPPGGGGGLNAPARGDVIWSSDYVMHRATVIGCPQEVTGTVKEVRQIFDESSDGLLDSDFAEVFAYQRMKAKLDPLYDKYFATPKAAAAMFAKSKPPADPPQFPSRPEADTERMTRLEKAGAWFLTDIERFDRPPVSIAFHFDHDYQTFPVDPDPLMEDIVQFPHLRRLGLRELKLEDKHLARLPELKELRELWLGSEAITAAGMAHVAKIPQLEVLWLYDTQAPDDEIAPLASCQRLKQFGLTSVNLGDAACRGLAKVGSLEHLHLGGAAITDKGAEHLKVLGKLTRLDLGQTQLTDASAPHLAELISLEHLYLRETGLTDASVPHLKKLTKLKELVVSGTKISAEGTAELKRALPMCEVSGN